MAREILHNLDGLKGKTVSHAELTIQEDTAYGDEVESVDIFFTDGNHIQMFLVNRSNKHLDDGQKLVVMEH